MRRFRCVYAAGCKGWLRRRQCCCSCRMLMPLEGACNKAACQVRLMSKGRCYAVVRHVLKCEWQPPNIRLMNLRCTWDEPSVRQYELVGCVSCEE